MNYVKSDQTTYTKKLTQSNYIENKNDPRTYLNRIITFLNRVYYGNYDPTSYYDVILRGLYTKIEINDNVINITISPGLIIIDSILFEIKNEVYLSLNKDSLPESDSLFIVCKYKHDINYGYNPLKIEAYLYNTLKGEIYPNIWNHDSHYIFLNIFSINNNKLNFYSRPDIPDCKPDIIPDPDPNPDPEEIDYQHSHSFNHSHTHTEDHFHENINIDLTDVGGADIPPSPDPPENPPEDNRPLCSDFIDYNEIELTKIIIDDIEYDYISPKRYLDDYVKLFYLHVNEYALQYHLRGLKPSSIYDIFQYNLIPIHSLYKNM